MLWLTSSKLIAAAVNFFVLVFVTNVSGSGFSQGADRPRQLLVGYWGQNSIGKTLQDSSNKHEKPLRYFCSKDSKFDIIVIAFIDQLFHPLNKDRLPGINLSRHCGFAPNKDYPGLFKCTKIEQDIKLCQDNGKKVTISLGGSTGDGTLGTSERALKLANNVWNLFLGGKKASFEDLRPFGSAILDGVDLDIESGSYKYYPIFVKEIHRLMMSDASKYYIITASPQCPFPDEILGPKRKGDAFTDTGKYFDHVYVQFYNNPCWPGNFKWFNLRLEQWLGFASNTTKSSKRPLIFIGVPAGLNASWDSEHYLSPDEFSTIYRSIRHVPGVGGVMLWDCSWDQNSILGNTTRHYSEFVHDLLLQGEVHLIYQKKKFGKKGNKAHKDILTSYMIFFITMVNILFILMI